MAKKQHGKTMYGLSEAEFKRSVAQYHANRRRVLSGETYRSQKPSSWQRGKGPGSCPNPFV